MNTQRPVKNWKMILIIVAIAILGVYIIAGSWIGLPTVTDMLTGHLGPVFTCNSDHAVLLAPFSPIVYIAVDEQSLYWIMRGNGQDPASVMTMSKSSGRIQVLAKLQMDPYGLLVDDKSVFWVEGTWQPDANFVLKEVDKRGGDITELWRTQGTILQLNMDADHLFWLNYEGSVVLRMPKKGGEPEVMIAGVEDLVKLSVTNGQIYLGGGSGLRLMQQPEQTPRTLITSAELLQDLNIGLRDERSVYYTDRVIQDNNNEVIFEFYVGNNPGWGSCSDNATYISGLSKADGALRSIAVMAEYLTDIQVVDPYLYLIGGCVGGKMVNIDTGETSDIGLGSDAFALAVDKSHLYWTDREGLKCIRRPRQ
jgi:hypothetical protein